MAPKKPLVSVVIVTYQHVNYIAQCLDSILNQKTNFEYEIIVGEDESKDGTREICIDYSIKHPDKIKLFLRTKANNDDATGRTNFIACLKEVKGKYIALCDGDDYWTNPLKLQKQVDFLENNIDYSGCFHFTQQINEAGQLEHIHGKHGNKVIFDAADTFSTTALCHTSSFMYKKEAASVPIWFNNILGADMAIFSMVASKGMLHCIPEIMSVYRKHSGGLTNSSFATFQNYHQNRISLMNYLNEYHDKKCNKKAQKIIKFHQNSLDGKNVDSLFVSVKKTVKRIIPK